MSPSKCPHICITQKRVSDTMWNGIPIMCRGVVLSCGWCEEHKYSHQLLEIGSVLNYIEVDLTTAIIDHGNRQNIGRIILAGVENWEAYAEYVSEPHVRRDIVRLKARYDL